MKKFWVVVLLGVSYLTLSYIFVGALIYGLIKVL